MSFKTILPIILIVIVSSNCAFAVNSNPTYPANVSNALDSAGENRVELEKVLSIYRNDSLKYEAACYLIGNMPGHSYVTYKLVDTNNVEIPFNALDYPTYDSLTHSFDSLQAKRGSLDFRKKDEVEDIYTIKADFLINHIDYAFRAWKGKPWAKKLSFDQFCRSVLPYRGSNEPLETWRPYFLGQVFRSLLENERLHRPDRSRRSHQ